MAREYLYGEMFERFGIRGMGRQGAPWCALNAEGILVLMAHQNYFHGRAGNLRYEMPPDEPSPPRKGSAKTSLDAIAAYFAPDRPIILLAGIFATDGSLRQDGTWGPSKFDHATGDYYEARMKKFERNTGYLLCEVGAKRSL